MTVRTCRYCGTPVVISRPGPQATKVEGKDGRTHYIQTQTLGTWRCPRCGRKVPCGHAPEREQPVHKKEYCDPRQTGRNDLKCSECQNEIRRAHKRKKRAA